MPRWSSVGWHARQWCWVYSIIPVAIWRRYEQLAKSYKSMCLVWQALPLMSPQPRQTHLHGVCLPRREHPEVSRPGILLPDWVFFLQRPCEYPIIYIVLQDAEVWSSQRGCPLQFVSAGSLLREPILTRLG